MMSAEGGQHIPCGLFRGKSFDIAQVGPLTNKFLFIALLGLFRLRIEQMLYGYYII